MEKKKPPTRRKLKTTINADVNNGLTEVIMGFNANGSGTQVTQSDTLFRNMRNYMVSNMRSLLSQAYVEHGLVQTIVNVPVDDGLRGGVEIKSKQLSSEELEDLETYLDRNRIMTTVVGQAMKWNRLFGGAGIVIITDQDPTTPLDLSLISESSNLDFRAVDMWELFTDRLDAGQVDLSGKIGQVEYYNYYGIKLHHSRVIKLIGLEAPSFVRPRLRGWGFSVVESLVNSINQYLKTNELTFEVLDEFKLDVFKFKSLSQTLMSADGTRKVTERVQLANFQKNFQNAIVMDSEDDYAQKQLSFAGVAEMMQQFRIQIASDMRMPLTKLFGLSAAGLSAGEEDIENYNATVESEIRSKCKYEIIRVLEIACQKLFGYVPDDLKVDFRPLRIMSSEQEQAVKSSKLDCILKAQQAGLMSSKEAQDAINKDNILSIKVDTTLSELPKIQDEDAGT